ncbi:MAG: hypothetical protein GXP16_15905 [Gammaproteobacteria bacterium]|nr:hypothetical protein [Gammaproteobacteria bacterium]
MPYLLEDQTDNLATIQAVEITGNHFGANLLITDETFDDAGSTLSANVSELGVTTLRYPGGSVTEQYFDIENPYNTQGTFQGNTENLVPLDTFFNEAAELGADVNIVVPTSGGFTETAAQAFISESYGNRTIDPGYISATVEFVRKAIVEAESKGVSINAIELGNEFWGSGLMTASEYGKLAGTLAVAIQVMFDDPGNEISINPDIVVQSLSAAGAYSPNLTNTVYYDSNNYVFKEDPGGATSYIIESQGTAAAQNQDIIDAIGNITGAASAIDGVTIHYYQSQGFDDPDGGTKNVDDNEFVFDQLAAWKELIGNIKSYITEWDTRMIVGANNSGVDDANNRGLQQASMLVEMFYEMVTHGVDSAQIWPLSFSGVQNTALTDWNGDDLSIAGEMFKMMSESLVGLTASLDWSIQGVIDIQGFSNVATNGDFGRLVLFASERSGVQANNVDLDLSSIPGTGEFFMTYTLLWDGGGTGGGQNADAEPVLTFSDGAMFTLDQVTIDLEAWSIARVEITYVGDGDDTIIGRGRNDVINSRKGADTIFGGAGNDQILGGNGNDNLYGNSGNDSLNGGNGSDSFFFVEGDGQDIVEDFNPTLDYLYINGVLVSDFENLPSGVSISLDPMTNELVITYGTSNPVDHIRFTTTPVLEAAYPILYNLPILGGSGDDILAGTASNEYFSAFEGNDKIYTNGGDDIVSAGAGNDKIYLNSGSETVMGDDGVDTVYYDNSTAAVTVDLESGMFSGGWAEGDVLTGIERVVGSDYNDVISGDTGVNVLWGRDGNDQLDGNGGNDSLFGEEGADTLDGGDGNDILSGGAGADILIGGLGKDRLRYDSSSLGVTVNLLFGTASGGDAEGDVFSSIEDLWGSNSSSSSDFLTGDGNANRIWGRNGDDTLDGGRGDDNLWGGNGIDTFLFYEGDGNDTIEDFEVGTDIISLNLDEGYDLTIENGGILIKYSTGSILVEGSGLSIADVSSAIVSLASFGTPDGSNNTINGTSASEIIRGLGGIDTLKSGGGDDILYGGEGNDYLYGGSGNTRFYGGNGNDQLNGSTGIELFFGDAGIDQVRYTSSTSFVKVNLTTGVGSGGFAEGDFYVDVEDISGSSYDDELTGNSANNRLFGRNGNDLLIGNDGDDYLRGDAGDDILTGGTGSDKFVFRAPDGNDTITDFEDGVDFVNLIGFNWADLTISSSGIGTLISISGGGQVILEGVDSTDISSSDFIFS